MTRSGARLCLADRLLGVVVVGPGDLRVPGGRRALGLHIGRGRLPDRGLELHEGERCRLGDVLDVEDLAVEARGVPQNTLSRIVALPCALVVGFAQLMVLGFDACTRVNTFSVGRPASGPLVAGLPLNSSTQPLIWNAPLAPWPSLFPTRSARSCRPSSRPSWSCPRAGCRRTWTPHPSARPVRAA